MLSFETPELDDIVSSKEDAFGEPLCVPDDPLETIQIYPMEELKIFLDVLETKRVRERENTAGLMRSSQCEDAERVARRRGRPRKRREESVAFVLGQSRNPEESARKRGRPKKGAIDAIHSRGIPKRKRNNNHGKNHAWSVKPPELSLESSAQHVSDDRSSDASSSDEASSPKSSEATRRCGHCMTEETPQWRTGPDGRGTLCNACGIKYKNSQKINNAVNLSCSNLIRERNRKTVYDD
ncbi:uncharacterized protein A4U43_C09F6410 [Asparagus officinalis]|uniref:GATA-type domain-containing protein n=1 Tax=Asparagus officinalis TaxID=4686 RepID=A0A5P1E5Z8_ASPOF|nr:nitrogen regulatory protein areA-like [Asparagus officinalis]ONK57980.1 uncharacterized protein A4U43_C09F6410 [Asparagus officinalis]